MSDFFVFWLFFFGIGLVFVGGLAIGWGVLLWTLERKSKDEAWWDNFTEGLRGR